MKRKRKSQKTRDRHARNYAECIISVHLRNCEDQGSEQLRLLFYFASKSRYNFLYKGFESDRFLNCTVICCKVEKLIAGNDFLGIINMNKFK